MSHEICKSISRIRQNAEGKWYATLTSAVNNVRPLTYRKVDFIPQESKRKMIAVILHDIYNGNIHMTGKSPYATFIDECYYGIVKSPSLDKILHYKRYHNKVWEISSKHNYWHGQDIKPKMDAKRDRIWQKLSAMTDDAEMEWAKEYEGWTADKARYYLYIDGNAVVSFRKTTKGSRWQYRQSWDTSTPCKQFTAVEVAEIKKRLGDRRKVEASCIPSKADGQEHTEKVA